MPSLRCSTTAATLTPSSTEYITSTTPRRVCSGGGNRFKNFVRRIKGNMKVRYRKGADTVRLLNYDDEVTQIQICFGVVMTISVFHLLHHV